MARFEDAIGNVLAHEGGYVDHPSDPGGATNFGVSLRYLQSLGDVDRDGQLEGDFDRDGDVDADDIQRMTVDNAKGIYRDQWWDRHGYGAIASQDLATKVFDLAVNMGPRRAHRLLQAALNNLGHRLAQDGVLGPKTFAAIGRVEPDRLLGEFRCQAVEFYLDLIRRNPQREHFRRGWLRRACA